MLDVNEFLDNYRKSTWVQLRETGCFVAPPFFFCGHDESIAIRFSESEKGYLIFSDCHVTLDYLEIEGIDINLYQDKLEKILKRFHMIQDGNVFRMFLESSDFNYIRRCLGYFVQALCLIANIDL